MRSCTAFITMRLLMTNVHAQTRSGSVTYTYSPEKTLEEAEMQLSVGGRVLDDHLADRLESVANNKALPTATRARALSLMCRFG